MKQTDLAYTAGIIDGEGCIFVGLRGGNRSDNFVLKIEVVSVDERLIDWLIVHWDGCKQKRKAYGKRQREPYSFTVSSASAGKLLAAVLPYLVIKQEQARLALEFQARKTCKGTRLTVEEIDIRREMAEELSALKR